MHEDPAPSGSNALLNGHIHHTKQKVEGNVTFDTAASMAFPALPPHLFYTGRILFQKNYTTYQGAYGEGGEGSNLQKRILTGSTIATTIKNGVKGEMPAFG